MHEIINEDLTTELASGIDDSQTTMSIVPVAGSPSTAPFRVWIGAEMIIVREVSGGDYSSCIRGAEGTLIESHASGAIVLYPIVGADDLIRARHILEMIAEEDISPGGGACCCSFLTDGESEIIFLDGQPITVCDMEA